MGRDDHRRPRPVDAVQKLHDADRRLRIEVSGRLVGDQQTRVVHERARNRDALLLATGEFSRQTPTLLGEANEREHFLDLAADLARRLADDLQRVGDVVGCGAIAEEFEVLEDATDGAAQVRNLVSPQRPEITPADHDAAGVELKLLHHRSDEGRLPGA